jgi:hypothetical protein
MAGCAAVRVHPLGRVVEIDALPDGGVAASCGLEAGEPAAAVTALGAAAASDAALDNAAAPGAAVGGPAIRVAAIGVLAAGDGGSGDGGELPAAGKWLPLGSRPAVPWMVALRLGFPPASLKALAKSWLLAPGAAESDAAELSWLASLPNCEWETGGVAFIPVK